MFKSCDAFTDFAKQSSKLNHTFFQTNLLCETELCYSSLIISLAYTLHDPISHQVPCTKK